MTGSSKQRSEVWRGVRKKTSGGLTKADLIKNKRGKIVSKKKSVQAANQNNLGELLRTKGAKMKKSEIMHPKGKAAKPKPAAPKPKAKPKAAAPKPKVKPKLKVPPKAAAPKQKAKPKPKPAPAKPKKKKMKPKPGINPITQQPYEKKSGLGFVGGGKVNLDNVMRRRKRRETLAQQVARMKQMGY